MCEKSAQSSVQPSVLRAAEDRTDGAQAGMQGAEKDAAAKQAARRVVEQLLAAEAALADVAEERSLHESATRRQAEAQRDVWRAIAGDRGSQGGRGGRGHAPQ